MRPCESVATVRATTPSPHADASTPFDHRCAPSHRYFAMNRPGLDSLAASGRPLASSPSGVLDVTRGRLAFQVPVALRACWARACC